MLGGKVDVSQAAEWLPVRTVLLCEPGIETLFALLEIHSANFLRPFSPARARQEHRAFRRALEAAGARVIDLREALAWHAGDDPDALTRLRAWAQESVRYEFDVAVKGADRDLLRENLRRAIEVFEPATLADLILLRPRLTIRPNPNVLDPTSRFLSRFEVLPANNAYYMRDPLITTRLGCVIGRLRLDVRRVENDVAEYALRQLGIAPLYRVQAPGFLEGGDFMPAGDFVLQGQGLLSDEDGVGQLLERRVYGYVEVAVVKDRRSQMDEMHLDTYFSLLGPDLCAVCEDRAGKDQQPEVDVYRPQGPPDRFVYRKVKTCGFLDYLAGKGLRVLFFSKEEQENFAPNGLLTAPYRFIGVRQAGEAYEGRLQSRGVQTVFLDFAALTGGYGGPHCSSQVIYRAV